MIVDLLSPLPRAECAKRLHQHISSEWSLLTDSGVIGRIDGDSFRIRKKIYYRNSFQQYLYGQLSDAGGGTRIPAAGGGTRIHGETREMNLKWIIYPACGVAALAFFGVLVTMLQHRAQLHDVPLVLFIGPALVVPLLAAIGVGAVALGRRLARSEHQYLVDFLKSTLEVR